MENCWICQKNIADSLEHKFKYADLKRIYGKTFSEEIIYKSDDKEFILQSSNDKKLKHKKVICKHCNNTTTQQGDRAYDKFIKYITGNFETFKIKGSIDYNDIYPDNWSIGKENFYRYIAKQAGCRIAVVGKHFLPANLSSFILGNSHNNSIKLFLIQKEGIQVLKLWSNNIETVINLTNGSTAQFRLNNKIIFHGWISYDWLTIHWFCGDNINPSLKNKEVILHEKFSIQGRDEKINLLDWIDNFGMESMEKRFDFIKMHCL